MVGMFEAKAAEQVREGGGGWNLRVIGVHIMSINISQ